MALLAQAVGTTRKFAGSVVSGVRAGTEAELYKRRRRCKAVGPELLALLEEFLMLPHISRQCPHEEVSISYGKRREKYRMCVSKEAALSEFKATQPCQLAISTILKYWPKQFVTPSSHDRKRNVCPTHDNMSRLVEALHSAGVGKNIPSSCRAIYPP